MARLRPAWQQAATGGKAIALEFAAR